MFVKLTFTLDKDLLIKELNINESYNADSKMGSSDLEAYLNIKYEVDTDRKIPTLADNIRYSGTK